MVVVARVSTGLDAAARRPVGEMDSVMAAVPDSPPQTVVLVSAGASHSVALLSKPGRLD